MPAMAVNLPWSAILLVLVPALVQVLEVVAVVVAVQLQLLRQKDRSRIGDRHKY